MTRLAAFLLFVGLTALDAPAQVDARVPSDPPERWFRGNLHTHSLWSDGNDYPEMIVDWYARRGYHFLALSDHNTLNRGIRWIDVDAANQRAGQDALTRYRERFGDQWVETRTQDNGTMQVRLKPLGEYRTLFERPGQFLLIQSEEITDRFESKPIHLNASNLVEMIMPQGGSSVVDVMSRNLAAAEEQAVRLGQAILTHLNHPNFGYAITAEELALVTKENFFEVYNGHPDVHHEGDSTHAGTERMWDIINTLRIGEMSLPPVYGLATDDSHNYFSTSGSSPGRGWIMVRARFLTPESLIRAIEAGDFYASSGVTLSRLETDRSTGAITIEIEAEADAAYTTRFLGTREGYDPTHEPVLAEDGSPMPVTNRYSDDVGEVLATVEGTRATYTPRGDELYVRAEITSSLPPLNPSFEGQRAQAWTQPTGWRSRLSADSPTPLLPAENPLDNEALDDIERQLYREGLAQSLAFRERLLTRDERGARAVDALAGAIVGFRDESGAALAGRPGLQSFAELSAADLVARMEGRGRSVDDSMTAFDGFSGRWFGRWDSMDVDHQWSRTIVLDPGRGDAALGACRVLASQSAWIGDGFGWNVVIHDPTADAAFVLGTVYHVEPGQRDPRRVQRHRPHVGVACGPGRMLWISAGEVFFEEILPADADRPERYAITGFRYRVDEGGRVERQREGFQAIYSRVSDGRVPFFTISLPMKKTP